MGYHFDPESFLPSARDMDGLKLATLDTLQHRLTRDAESADRLTHRKESHSTPRAISAGLHVLI